MKRLISHLLGLGFAASPALSQGAGDARLAKIVREFEEREGGGEGSKFERHRIWSRTAHGEADLIYLADHYDELSDRQKYQLPMELARTGAVEVTPLVKRALNDPRSSVFSGVFFACRIGDFDPEYGHQIAPSLIPLLGMKHLGEDRALKLLPALDQDLAGEALFNEAWLSPEAPDARSVLRAFNHAGRPVPAQWVRPLTEKWRARALADVDRKDQWAYAAALTALARIDPHEAIAKSEEWIAKYPQEARDVAGVYLIASGLSGLHQALAKRINSPKDLESLPDPARFFFAVSIFESDWMNGGTFQAFSNSTGDFIPWTKEGYKAIGDTDRLVFIEKVCALFGPAGPPIERNERKRQMKEMRPSFSKQVEGWENNEHPETENPTRIPTDILLGRYAARNAETLRPFLK